MISKESPAKVNLYLRVLRKREDGYHDILSLMQRINLCDEMTFNRTGSGIVVRCPGSDLPEGPVNIAYRAAETFFRHTGARADIEITIRKRIPVGAGLGGGSSNAATTIMTLNEMCGRPVNQSEMMSIGAKIGADVPFFIFRKAAWASGIGDVLEEAPPLPHIFFLLINPGFEVSTKNVYDRLNLGLTSRVINYSIPRFYTAEDLIGGLVNDLETVTLQIHPELDQIKKLLIENGARGAMMSGSGPTVFGIFADDSVASEAEKRLGNKAGWRVFRANPL